MRTMFGARALGVGLGLLLAACSGSGGGGGGTPTGPTGSAGTGTSGGTGGGGGGPGGSGGGGGGSTGASLSTTGFRTVLVTVTPAEAGHVSDNLGAVGSAIRDCTACRERYRLGTAVVLTATPAGQARFDRWQGGPCDGSPSSTCAFTVSSDLELTAVFR